MDILKQSSTTRENLGDLAVLEALEAHESASQRELARITGLNLKKVNYCLHKLMEKGYIKFQKVRTNPDKRSYLYILTPAGFKIKSKLTYDFLRFTFDFYSRVEDTIQKTIDRIESLRLQRIALYGRNDATRIFVDLIGPNLEVVAILEDEPTISNSFGLPVVPLSMVSELEFDGVLVMALDDPEAAVEKLAVCGVQDDAIWRLL